MNIYEKLQKCRIELQRLKLKKSGKNKFSGFSYFELSDFLPAVNELFDKYKLFSNFSIVNEGMAKLTIIDSEYINSMKFTIDNRTGETNIYPPSLVKEFWAIEFTSPIEELELKGCNKIQALGGIHTYMKRYLYLNALEIVENDIFSPLAGSGKLEQIENIDSEPTSKQNKSSKKEKDVLISSEQKNELKTILGGVEFAKLANSTGGRIPIEKYNEIIKNKKNGGN